jgi:hypothetical protein
MDKKKLEVVLKKVNEVKLTDHLIEYIADYGPVAVVMKFSKN